MHDAAIVYTQYMYMYMHDAINQVWPDPDYDAIVHTRDGVIHVHVIVNW